MKLSDLPFWGELGARLGGALLVPVVVVGGLVAIVGRFTELPDGAAFRVGDATVSEDQFGDRVDVLEALYGIRAPTAGPDADGFRRLAAKTLAVGMVVDSVAKMHGISVPESAVAQRLAGLVVQHDGAPDRAGFIQLLSRIGASEQDVRDEITRRETHARLFDAVAATVPGPTDEAVRRAYDEHRAELVAPEQRRLRNIVTAGRPEADVLLARARGGADFASLAREHSLDQATRDQGGDLGLLTQEQMLGPYAAAAFTVAGGEFFGPVRTEFGWNIGQVVHVVPTRPLGFDEATATLRERLRSERVIGEWNTYLGARIRAADVRYTAEYRPEDPDSPLPPPTPTDRAAPR